jgi:MOSC domain-containing protein YiiM/GNAT superfamily N-acetyltransferase
MLDQPLATGRVLQVNVSAGGVPKLPVDKAWVGRYGLEGDKHREDTVHGGPHRAVCLFGMEVIERLQSEGHPIEPGGAGENLTTSGIEWSLLPIGARARIGDRLELEIASSTTPCATQTNNFRDGKFNRILIDRHPSDSRMYARVLREGEVKPGDEVVVLPPAPDSRAADEELLRRLERAEGRSTVAAWRAAREAGFQIDFSEDGELGMASSRDIPGPAFNQAIGLPRLPNLLARATAFFDRHGTAGWIWMAEGDLPVEGAQTDLTLDVFGATPDQVADLPAPDDVVIRLMTPEEASRFPGIDTGGPAGGVTEGTDNPWPRVNSRLALAPYRHTFVAEIGGRPVGNAALHATAKTGWMRAAIVAPEARGRGIQRALISARARLAAELGCTLVGASAESGEVSARNLERAGLRVVGRRSNYVYEGGGHWR